MKNNKSLGQHWLKNRAILDKIADLAINGSCLPRETCLEIGPGLGTLTSSLLKRFAKVIAVEFDPRLAANLPKSFPGKNLEVIHGDILNTDIPALIAATSATSATQTASTYDNLPATQTTSTCDNLPATQTTPAKTPPATVGSGITPDYVIVGNIPYYITSPIIRQVTHLSPAPRRVVLLIQKEVAERIAADAGSHSLLSLMTQNRAEVFLGPVVPAREFTPPPKVDSQVIVLEPLASPQIDDAVFSLIRLGFSNPRKKLSANLAGHPAKHPLSKVDWEDLLRREGINPGARAEDLSLWDWEALYNLTH